MTQKVKWGLLSTANINDMIIDGIKKAKRSELRAVASRDMQKARKYAAEKGIPNAYGSYDELLTDPDIDVVYISVPNTLHSQLAVKAIEAEKNVLCEKPLVTTMEDFSLIENALQKNSVVLFEAFMYLHHPQTRKVVELVQERALGELLYISSWFDYYLPDEEKGNIRVKKELDGGSLWDVGVYPNSMAITLASAGAPVEVRAVTRHKGTEVDSSSYGTLRFSNNVISQICASIKSPFRQGTNIVGTDGFIAIDSPWKPGLDGRKSQIAITDKNDTRRVFRFPGVSPYQSEVESMEACLLDGAKPVVSFEQSRDFLRSMLALHSAAASGKAEKP